MDRPTGRGAGWAFVLVFLGVLVGHALYIRRITTVSLDGWADTDLVDNGFWGLGPYLKGQDYCLGFAYALGAGFAVWSLVYEFGRAIRAAGKGGHLPWRSVLMTVGLATLLRWGVCFLLGCCGSPMLAVYATIFGAKAFHVGKPMMALVTLLSVGCGYWCLSHRFARGGCLDACCEHEGSSTLIQPHTGR